jgi:hypothetical protein
MEAEGCESVSTSTNPRCVPFDVVPDFIPVIGSADDAVSVAFALRSVTRQAGPAALDRHWPESPDGLAAVRCLAGLPASR